ncbi:MAG: hypothetical protein C5B51_16465 [Terriglobia bacterium]|nr:MAG: hypothetical protein C5B51_16465 [Terriglobia bacterium]
MLISMCTVEPKRITPTRPIPGGDGSRKVDVSHKPARQDCGPVQSGNCVFRPEAPSSPGEPPKHSVGAIMSIMMGRNVLYLNTAIPGMNLRNSLAILIFGLSCLSCCSGRSLRERADRGDAKAQLKLGEMYRDGEGVPQDSKEAAKWYRMAADQGDARAQYSLGLAYEKGKGVTQDGAEAVRWYHKAAENGNTEAQFSLGVFYSVGANGLPEDEGEAARWYRKAAEQGYPTAQCSLGSKYFLGRGVPQDYAEAARWYRKAADQGETDAQYFLGEMYEEGRAVAQNYVQAHMWYNLAASRAIGDNHKRDVRSRESVADKMTPAQIAEAQRLATDWRPKSGKQQ